MSIFNSTSNGRHMTPEQKQQELAKHRDNVEKILAGTLLVPTTTCRKCGGYARVSNNMHNLERPKKPGYQGVPQTITIVGEVTICQNEKCRHVAVSDNGSMDGLWFLRDVEVEIVRGQSFVMKDLPIEITQMMRKSWEAFLAETDPKKALQAVTA